jgi:hypothetical protein
MRSISVNGADVCDAIMFYTKTVKFEVSFM